MSFLTTNPAYFLVVMLPPELDFLKDLRWILVSTLYALVLAEIAHQSVRLVARRCGWLDISTGVSHLLLLTGLVTTSWVGWSVAIAKETHPDHRLETIFSLPYLLLLIDVWLLTVYFIFAKTAGIPKEKTEPIKSSAKPESFWLMVVFGGYILWDIVAYGLLEEDWSRLYPTVFCFVLSWLSWLAFKRVTIPAAVLVADAGLFALIFLFRAMKALCVEKGFYLWIWIGGLGAVFLFCLVLARLLNRKPQTESAGRSER